MGKRKKSGKNKTRTTDKPAKKSSEEPRLSLSEIQALEKAESHLKAGLAPFQQGDFVAARPLFDGAAQDSKLDPDAQQRAAELSIATRPERTAVLVGLACAAMLLLIALITAGTQP